MSILDFVEVECTSDYYELVEYLLKYIEENHDFKEICTLLITNPPCKTTFQFTFVVFGHFCFRNINIFEKYSFII